MAINGQGFFNVQKPIGITDNAPVFDGTTDYTRRGDFQLNASGNLVNGAGYYLMGVAVDPKTGNPIGNVPTVLQFAEQFHPGAGDDRAFNMPPTFRPRRRPRHLPAPPPARWSPRAASTRPTSPPATTRW